MGKSVRLDMLLVFADMLTYPTKAREPIVATTG
jgi:hypothetical protein